MAASGVEELTIALPADVADAVRSAIANGDFSSESDVVRAALRDWAIKRNNDADLFAGLKPDIDEGMADLAAGRLKDFDVDAIVERGRKQLAAG